MTLLEKKVNLIKKNDEKRIEEIQVSKGGLSDHVEIKYRRGRRFFAFFSGAELKAKKVVISAHGCDRDMICIEGYARRTDISCSWSINDVDFEIIQDSIFINKYSYL